MYIWWQNGISVFSCACTAHSVSPDLIPDSSAELDFPYWIASGGDFLECSRYPWRGRIVEETHFIYVNQDLKKVFDGKSVLY